ncbi:MAG: hypothetical protein AB7K52_05610 [Phycisphaerales bacterium]
MNLTETDQIGLSPDAVADSFASEVSGRRGSSGREPTDIDTLEGDATSVIVIRTPGRYVLSRHLRGARGRAGIRILADDVTLDLRGHALVGCEFSLDGLALGDSVCNVRIANGSVRSWGGVGADLAGAIRARLENVRVFDNQGGALRLGPSALLTDCVVGGDIKAGIEALETEATAS